MSNARLALQFEESLLAPRLLRERKDTLPRFSVSGLREDVQERARIGWEERTRTEYSGMLIMRQLHALLVETNAPLDWQELGLTLQLHEQRHARFCNAAAAALGSDGLLTFDNDELQIEAPAGSVGEALLKMICGTLCVGEVIALELLLHANRTLPVSGYRTLLRRIAKDEVLHARVGAMMLREMREGRAAWIDYPGDAWMRTEANKHIAGMKTRDVVAPEDLALFADNAAATQMLRLGIPPPADFKRVFFAAIDKAVPQAFAAAGISL